MSSAIAQMILNQARQTGADPLTLLATAIVESNLNPNAVGDGGTSYGLYQMHVGGAGGGSHAEARRYLDPRAAIENRARHFRGGQGGSFAASVQRPADPAGYAKKVDAVIAQLRSGKLPYAKGNLNAPVRSTGVTAPSAGTSDRKAAALGLIFDGDPMFAAAARPEPAPTPARFTPSQPGRAKIGKDYRWIQQMGQKLFGLRNDAGDSQLTGGRHSAGSEHYDGRAVDFGDAKNSRAQLNAWRDWAKRQGLDVLDEGDHIHVSLPGSGI